MQLHPLRSYLYEKVRKGAKVGMEKLSRARAQGPGELEAQHHLTEAERKWQTGLLRIQVLCRGGHLNFKETGLGCI